MRSRLRILVIAGAACAAVGACGSDETSPAQSSSTAGGGGQGGAGGDPTPEGSCVRPGDKGNDKGVGEYCTPGGNECEAFPEAPACLAKFGQDQWMCTRIGCNAMTNCGEGAGCLITDQGSACIPCRCDDSGVGCSGGGGAGGGGGGGSGGGGGTGGGGGAGGN